MKDLLIEYRKTRLNVLSKIKKLEQSNNNELDDLPLYKSMLADINYVIDWLKEGHQPGNYNAIDKSQCYLVDQQVIAKACDESMYKKISNEEYKNIVEDINNPISYALMKLTPIELECFIMVKCEGLSYSEVANLLGVKRGTIQKHLERAKCKINLEIDNNLFINID
ncbi:sigma factor-like helix-turn-helix DNA-binding protein [Staphylococcus epidermidis]|uniref:sigma factor-like helix-turn-helix DNA-binding protein n=1 Tax=Staphylococcus epidermidis TaxID=1282 RepID=UPI0034D61D93